MGLAGAELLSLLAMELSGALSIFLAVCLSCLALTAAWRRMHKGGKLPPGPTPLPFLGNLLQVATSETFKSFLAVSVSPLAGLWKLLGEALVRQGALQRLRCFKGGSIPPLNPQPLQLHQPRGGRRHSQASEVLDPAKGPVWLGSRFSRGQPSASSPPPPHGNWVSGWSACGHQGSIGLTPTGGLSRAPQPEASPLLRP